MSTTTTTATPAPEPWRPTRSYGPRERDRVMIEMGKHMDAIDCLELLLDPLDRAYRNAPPEAQKRVLPLLREIDGMIVAMIDELRRSIPNEPQRKAR